MMRSSLLYELYVVNHVIWVGNNSKFVGRLYQGDICIPISIKPSQLWTTDNVITAISKFGVCEIYLTSTMLSLLHNTF